jgi:predicted transcriptional regulator
MDDILQYPVKSLTFRQNVLSVSANDVLVNVIQSMDRMEISALPVTDQAGHFTGVISRTDIGSRRLFTLLKEKPLEKITVKDLMNQTPPVYIHEDRPIAEVISLMHNRHIRRVFVINAQNQIYGVVTTTDIVKLLFIEKNKDPHKSIEEQRKHLANVEDRHRRYMEDIGWESI